MPEAGFYLWPDLSAAGLREPVSDTSFAQALYRDYNVKVLPGSYLARSAQGRNPGENFLRLALVASTEETAEAAQRIAKFVSTLK
jgi:N-succinyldiaminopimelate aminotransferase